MYQQPKQQSLGTRKERSGTDRRMKMREGCSQADPLVSSREDALAEKHSSQSLAISSIASRSQQLSDRPSDSG